MGVVYKAEGLEAVHAKGITHRGAASFAYGLTADKHYLPLSETKANIWLAEPVSTQKDSLPTPVLKPESITTWQPSF